MSSMRLNAKSVLLSLAVAAGAAAAIGVPGTASGAVLSGTRAAAATATENELSGVSCPAVKECLAVGSKLVGTFGNSSTPLAETWNGTTWKAVTVPLPADGVTGDLDAVSCPTTTKCIAVGGYRGEGYPADFLVETWNGKTWSATSLPNPGSTLSAELEGISCPTASFCVAVGEEGGSAGSAAVSETWNGSTWAPGGGGPVPAGAVGSALRSVSCSSATSCLEVGTYTTATATSVLADSWNGKTGKLLPKAAGNQFTGVSCTSPTHCIVVGNTANPGDAPADVAGLADQWNGTKWSATKLSWPKTGNSYLYGVSCTKAGPCATAGGEDMDLKAPGITGRARVANWNGKAWTIANLPALNAGRADVFNAVSCPSATTCVAVGHYGTNKTELGAGWAGVWNGTTWKQAAAV